MADKINLDLFMISLEVAVNDPELNLIFWLDYLKSRIKSKIHIISFRIIRDEIKNKYLDTKFLWVPDVPQSFIEIKRYIKKQCKNDIVIIVGSESYLQKDENWNVYAKQIDELFNDCQSIIEGLIFICNINDEIAYIINDELNSSNNMSICVTNILDSIEKQANFLVDNKEYRKAAACFRKRKEPYYELLARVNDLLAKNETDIKKIEEYIFEVVKDNPELKNEAIFKVALYAENYMHYYYAYNILKTADLNKINATTQEIVKKRIEILSDTEKASKALCKIKPYTKKRDVEILLKNRCSLLLECIEYFSYIKNGYFNWRKLLDCQQVDTWNISLKSAVMNCVKKLKTIDFQDMLAKSYINNLNISGDKLNVDTAIHLLRLNITKQDKFEEMQLTRDDFMYASQAFIEEYGTDKEKIWCKYYCSINASLLSENPQEANNFSITLQDLEGIVTNSEKALVAALFLMSWGNSQFRLGNFVEGLACTIIAIKQLLALNEANPILEEGINILSKYLSKYSSAFSNIEKKEIYEGLKTLKIYNRSLNVILIEYGDCLPEVIQEIEKEIETSKKDINWLIDLNNLIGLRLKNGDTSNAIKLINNNISLAKKLVEYRKDVGYQIFSFWGDVLLSCGGYENFMSGLDLLDKSLAQLDQRRAVYHQEERAGLAEEYEKIIRKMISFCSLYYLCNNIGNDMKIKLKEMICEKMSMCIPLSVIEQKNYNRHSEISKDLIKKDQRLKQLQENYKTMQKERARKDIVYELAKQIESLSNELVKTHPYYMPLEKNTGTNWIEIQKILSSNEVVYQYVLTDMVVVSILITDRLIDVKVNLFDMKADSPITIMKKYGEIVEKHINSDDIDRYSPIISQIVAKHMCEYVFNHEVKSIYLIPDISKSMFPFSAVQYNGEYLIDRVDEIVNFIDYKQLIASLDRPNDEVKIINKVFGKKEDASISYINAWLETYIRDNVISITDCSDDLRLLSKQCNKGINTIAIFGHGAKDPASSNVEGAQTIEGSSSMIKIENILEAISVKNLILISCMTGTPNSINPEISSGTWKKIFECFSGNILGCKWSVPTYNTIKMMEILYDNLLNEKMSFPKALLIAQRTMKNKGEKELSWAGVECWIN